MSVGVDVIDIGVVPTPTVQLAVEHHHAGAGLILTASHNPIEWNALKFVGPDGIFLDADAGAAVRALAEQGPPRDGLGRHRRGRGEDRRRDRAPPRPGARAPDDRRRADPGAALPRGARLRARRGRHRPSRRCSSALGCRVTAINLETDGRFPAPAGAAPRESRRPRRGWCGSRGPTSGWRWTPTWTGWRWWTSAGDADRRGLHPGVRGPRRARAACRQAPARRPWWSTSPPAWWWRTPPASMAPGSSGPRSARRNVARMIRDEGAVIGGEGNGGVILPALHIGRDAPVGVALILQLLAESGQTVSGLVAAAPRYHIVKAKAPRGADLRPGLRRRCGSVSRCHGGRP